MMKKRYLGLLLAGALLVGGLVGSLAYLQMMRKKPNQISIGTNTISVDEDFRAPKELQAGANVYKKEVRVKNDGTVKAFVRVFLDFSDYDIGSKSFLAAEKTGTVSIPDEATFDEAKSLIEAAGYQSYEDFFAGGDRGDDWIFIPESEDNVLGGYFYYTKILEPGAKTEKLLDSVCTYFESADQIKSHQIYVYAESVQTYDKDGNPYGEGQWRDAWKEFLK